MIGQNDSADRMMSNQPRQEYGASEYPKRTPSQPNGKDATEIYEPDKTGGTECEKLTNGKKCTESYDIEPIDVPLMSTEKSHAASIVHQRDRVLYKLDDVPPWYLTVLFGFQVTLENGDRLSAIWANTAHV